MIGPHWVRRAIAFVLLVVFVPTAKARAGSRERKTFLVGSMGGVVTDAAGAVYGGHGEEWAAPGGLNILLQGVPYLGRRISEQRARQSTTRFRPLYSNLGS
jgi:hypothetical protein